MTNVLDISFNTSERIGFREFLDFYAGYCSAEPTRDYIQGPFLREPPLRVTFRQFIQEVQNLQCKGVPLPVLKFRDPSLPFQHVQLIDNVLPVDELRVIYDLIQSITLVRDIFRFQEEREIAPSFYQWICSLPRVEGILEHFHQIFDQSWEIKDTASEDLRRIRKEIRLRKQEITNFYLKIIHDPSYQDILQEPEIVIRNRRYTLPIIREKKHRFPGIIHDQSQTGHTFFIEHQLMVEPGNELAECELEERDEIIKILQKLCAHIRHTLPALKQLYQACIQIDTIFAAVRYAQDYACHLVPDHDTIQLVQGRNVHLQRYLREQQKENLLIPIDLSLESHHRVILISGANAGGKTVALKTIGLILTMHAYGLPVPCSPQSRLPVYEAIFADIGDDQSIHSNLSTFTAHLRRLKIAMELAKEKHALLLLDELGTGTDPGEGAAIAGAILQELAQTGSVTLATSHLPHLKLLAEKTNHMINASVLFDEEHLRPLYKLVLGTAGASYGIVIAQQLHIPESVLKKAQEILDPSWMQIEQILARLAEKERTLDEERKVCEQLKENYSHKLHVLQQREQEWKEKRKEMILKARKEAEGIVRNTRQRMEKLLREMNQRRSQGDQVQAKQILKEVIREEDKISTSMADSPKGERRSSSLLPLTSHELSKLKPGDLVFVKPFHEYMPVISVHEGRNEVTVSHNGLTVQVQAKLCSLPKQLNRIQEQPKESVHIQVKTEQDLSLSPELNLIGLHIHEAIPKLEKYLDQATIRGLYQVKIIHGVGTGALYRAIEQTLSSSPYVTTFRRGNPGEDEGGLGVTWVELRQSSQSGSISSDVSST